VPPLLSPAASTPSLSVVIPRTRFSWSWHPHCGRWFRTSPHSSRVACIVKGFGSPLVPACRSVPSGRLP
jgi:hypothetical protein